MALSLIVELGEFARFAKGNTYGSWLGITPIQNTSSDVDNKIGITKKVKDIYGFFLLKLPKLTHVVL